MSDKPWRRSFGRKGVNRVTVYERPDGSSIYIEWWDDNGRNREVLRRSIGTPLTDRDKAVELAKMAAVEQEKKRNAKAAELIGLPVPRSVSELLAELHETRAPDWSERYAKEQERYRAFWEDRIGSTVVTNVRGALAERIARKHYSDKVSARRHALRYLIDAFNFAEKKLKWIEPRFNLSDVDLPKAENVSRAYRLDEARKLLPAMEEVDWRLGFIGHVMMLTGRRAGAVRRVPSKPGWFEDHGDFGIIHFPGETDKARNMGESAVYGHALRLARKAAGGRWRSPTRDQVRGWTEEAERRAGVPHVHRRGIHGLKRLYATLSKGHAGREKQSGTTGQTLDRVYVQDVLEPKVELARFLARKLGGE